MKRLFLKKVINYGNRWRRAASSEQWFLFLSASFWVWSENSSRYLSVTLEIKIQNSFKLRRRSPSALITPDILLQ